MAQVFPYLGWQVFDENGNPAPGAKARFFTAGTSTPVNVYSNSTLVTPHAVPVVADSEGRFPTIYAASGVYKVKVTDSADVDLFPEVDQLTILTDLTTTQLSFPTVTKTTNYTVLAADRGKVLEFDAAGATLIVTLKAATLGAGFPIWIVNSGATGTVQLQFDPGETLLGATTYDLVAQHQSVGITSRGAAGWRLFTASGNIPVLSAANVFTADQTIRSSDAGALVGPTVTLDRNSITPAAADVIGGVLFQGRDAGANATTYGTLVGLILDTTDGSEDGQLTFQTVVAGALTNQLAISSGLAMTGATGGGQGAGTVNATAFYQNGVALALAAATQAEMEAASSLSVSVSPGRQQFHPSAAKFWLRATGAGVLTESYNMTSVTDSGPGDLDGTIATDFSTATWCLIASVVVSSLDVVTPSYLNNLININAQAAGTFGIQCGLWSITDTTLASQSVAVNDPTSYNVVGYGDHA